MPWNGSGVFNRSTGILTGRTVWAGTKSRGRKIRTDDHDTHDEDLANGLENCVTRDGQNSPSANLPMAGRKHTNVANAAEDNEYAALGQVKAIVDPNVQTLTYATAVTWDVANVQNRQAKITLGGNCALTIENPKEGGHYFLYVRQRAAGGARLTVTNTLDTGALTLGIDQQANEMTFLGFSFFFGSLRLVAQRDDFGS